MSRELHFCDKIRFFKDIIYSCIIWGISRPWQDGDERKKVVILFGSIWKASQSNTLSDAALTLTKFDTTYSSKVFWIPASWNNGVHIYVNAFSRKTVVVQFLLERQFGSIFVFKFDQSKEIENPHDDLLGTSSWCIAILPTLFFIWNMLCRWSISIVLIDYAR